MTTTKIWTPGSTTLPKDPDDRWPYRNDWQDVLATGETISSQSVSFSTGITATGQGVTGNYSKVLVYGGTAGETYTVTDQITTSAGNMYSASVTISVSER